MIARARASYQRNIDRIRDGQGLPIEVLQAIQALEASERAYLRAVADYNRSQLQLLLDSPLRRWLHARLERLGHRRAKRIQVHLCRTR